MSTLINPRPRHPHRVPQDSSEAEGSGQVVVLHLKVQALAGERASSLARRVQETLRFSSALKGFDLEVSVADQDVQEGVKLPAIGGQPRTRSALGEDDSSVGKRSPPRQGDAAHVLLRHAANQGEARLVSWTRDGTLLPVSDIEAAWGISRQAIDAARRDRDELFSLFIKGQHWYPAEFLKLRRADLTSIHRALGDLDPASRLLFLLKRHGALGDRTPTEAVEAGMLEAVVRLAEFRVNA